MHNFIEINYNNRPYIINKEDSLKTLLNHGELFPMKVWLEIFELKDGMCSINLMFLALEASIKMYDKTLNIFYFKDKEYWLDKSTRLGIWNLVNCCPSDMELSLGDIIIPLSLDKTVEFLSKLEIYAGKCFIITAKHLLAIKELKTVADIINYDYTTGYPDKISLNE